MTQAYNKLQRKAMQYALTGKNILITGAGGTGKSVLIRDFCARLESQTTGMQSQSIRVKE